MSDEIRPALMPDAWRDQLAGTGRESQKDIAIGCVWAELSNDERDLTGDVEVMEEQFGERRPMLVLTWNLVDDRIAIGDRHALAALCLYQQPFGFSQEDIDRLRAMAVAFGPEVHESHRVWLRSLASRIAALLPPEPPGDRP